MTTAPTLTVTDVAGGKKVTAVNNEASIGGVVKYTTDGSTPSSESSTWPSAGLSFAGVGTTTVKAASFIGTQSSSVSSATVEVIQLTSPTVTAGTNSFTITSNDGEIDSDLYYRFGSSGSWTKYTEAVAITETVTVNAYSKKNGYVNSETVSQEITYTEPVTE